jgi:hypothetical protein
VNVRELLRRAAALIPDDARSDAGVSAAEVRDYLDHDECEIALGILQDFDGLAWQTVAYWDCLTASAELMWLADDARWCGWRRSETRQGIIRADLQLVSPEAGGRHTPIPGAGVLRPMWALGPSADGDVTLHIAFLWVESVPELPAGGRAPVRLLPLTPENWSHVALGEVITMHERQPVAGTATITQVLFPQGAGPHR